MYHYFIRHGHAEHQIGEFRQRVTWLEYQDLQKDWLSAELTPEGITGVQSFALEMKGKFKKILHSPLLRVRQTVSIMNMENVPVQQIELLSEIGAPPPCLPIRMSVHSWLIYNTVYDFFSFKIVRYLREAGEVLKQLELENEPCLVVSHQFRLRTLLLKMCIQPAKWRILGISLKPVGLTFIKKV